MGGGGSSAPLQCWEQSRIRLYGALERESAEGVLGAVRVLAVTGAGTTTVVGIAVRRSRTKGAQLLPLDSEKLGDFGRFHPRVDEALYSARLPAGRLPLGQLPSLLGVREPSGGLSELLRGFGSDFEPLF